MRLAGSRLLALAGMAATLTLAACGGSDLDLAVPPAAPASLAQDAAQDSGTPPREPLNGLERRTATEVVQAALDALREVESMHYVGTGTESGAPMTMDMRLTMAGSLTGSIVRDGQELKIIRVGDTMYLGGGLMSSTYPQVRPGQWVEVPVGQLGANPATRTVSSLSIAGVAKDFADMLDAEDGQVEQAVENGRPVVIVRTTDPDAEQTLTVANTGPALPLRHFTRESDGDEVEAVFSEYDEEFDIVAPPAASIVRPDAFSGTSAAASAGRSA